MNGVKQLTMNCQLEMDSCATRLVLHVHEKTISKRKQCVTTVFFRNSVESKTEEQYYIKGKKIKEKWETYVCTVGD